MLCGIGDFFLSFFAGQGAFPDNSDTEAVVEIRLHNLPVTLFVPADFFSPVLGICLGKPEQAAVLVSVPKASVNKNNSIVPGKNQIRSSDIPSVIFSEPESCPVNGASQNKLGLCVLAVNERHIPASLLRGKDVHNLYARIIQVIIPFF